VLVDLYRLLTPEGAKILLVLFLSFLTGLEREGHKAGSEQYSFGGVRTYPLIGLIAYAVSFLSGGQILPVMLGFAVVAGFLMLSYRQNRLPGEKRRSGCAQAPEVQVMFLNIVLQHFC
jgi:hypothetical protein